MTRSVKFFVLLFYILASHRAVAIEPAWLIIEAAPSIFKLGSYVVDEISNIDFSEKPVAENGGKDGSIGHHFFIAGVEACENNKKDEAYDWFLRSEQNQYIVSAKEELKKCSGSSYASKTSVNNKSAFDTRAFYRIRRTENLNKALKYVQNFAESGNLEAQSQLASLYDRNDKLQDYELANYWYKKLADQGYAKSQYELASGFRWGDRDVKVNYKKALNWFTKASKNGHKESAFQLGEMYEQGLGVSPDLKKAIFYYQMSEYEKAQNRIARIENNNGSKRIVRKTNNVKEKVDFTDLWQKYGGEILDPDSNQQVLYRSDTGVDKNAPVISINIKKNYQTYESNITLNGTLKDDTEVAELVMNGRSVNFEKDGTFSVARYLSLGQNTIELEAFDIFGNSSKEKLVLSRLPKSNDNQDKELEGPKIKVPVNKFDIAIIIGLEKYKSMPRANWADSDANTFYDFAVKSLGIRPENIKRLINEESNYVNIWKTLDNWLPSKIVKNESKVYIYFAGHGLSSEDGSRAYLLPYEADSAILKRTAIQRKDLINAVASLKPRHTTMFLDTCYSGNAKGGDKLLVASRGLRIVKKESFGTLPDNFTIFSAARNDETAMSHPIQKNGLFSYWLMRGISGEADSNNNNEITNNELHDFILNRVSKTAIAKGQKQNPELFGKRDEVISSWRTGLFN